MWSFGKHKEHARGNSLLSITAALAAIIFWSGTAIANKFVVAHIDGLSVGLIRSVLAGAIALSIAGGFRIRFPSSGKSQFLLLISGLLSFAVWPVLLSAGLQRTSASHAALIMAAIPLMTVLLSAVVEREMPSIHWQIGSTIAVTATAVLIGAQALQSDFDANYISWTGDVMIVFGAFACAGGYVSGMKVTSSLGAVTTTVWGLVFAAVFLAPFLISHVDIPGLVDSPMSWWLSMGWLVLFSSLLGYALWFFALAKSGVTKIATLQFLMPVITLAASVILLGEPFSIATSMLCVLIVSSTYFAQSNSIAEQRR